MVNRKAEDYNFSIADLPYLRKRVTQLENLVLVKDLKYKKLQNKYRAITRHLKKLLTLLGADKRSISFFFSEVPSIETKHIENELFAIIRERSIGRKYYEE